MLSLPKVHTSRWHPRACRSYMYTHVRGKCPPFSMPHRRLGCISCLLSPRRLLPSSGDWRYCGSSMLDTLLCRNDRLLGSSCHRASFSVGASSSDRAAWRFEGENLLDATRVPNGIVVGYLGRLCVSLSEGSCYDQRDAPSKTRK